MIKSKIHTSISNFIDTNHKLKIYTYILFSYQWETIGSLIHCIKRCLKVSQLILNYHYLEHKKTLSSNEQNLIWLCARSCVSKKLQCLKRLHSINKKKATNLICTKRWFNLTVRLIANECILLFILLTNNLQTSTIASNTYSIV